MNQPAINEPAMNQPTATKSGPESDMAKLFGAAAANNQIQLNDQTKEDVFPSGALHQLVKLLYILAGSTFSMILFDFVLAMSRAPWILDDYALSGATFSFENPGAARYPIFPILLKWLVDVTKSAVGTHVLIAIIHILSAGLISLALHRLFPQLVLRPFAIAAAFCLILSPVSTENLMWAAASYPVFSVFLWGAGLLSYTKLLQTPTRFWWVTTLALNGLLSLFGEQGVMLIAVQGILIFCASRITNRERHLIHDIWFTVRFSIAAITPYVGYRLFLFVVYGASSAVQNYPLTLSPGIVFDTFKRMFSILNSTAPFWILPTGIAIGLTLMLVAAIKKLPSEIRPLPWLLLVFPLGILFMMLPFSLLGGWLELRFFYVSAVLMTVYAAFVVGAVWKLGGEILCSYIPSRPAISSIMHVLLVIGMMTLVVVRARTYTSQVTRPNVSFKGYVENYVNGLTALRPTLNNQNVTIIIKKGDRGGLCSQFVFYGECWLAIAAEWVGKGLKNNKLAPEKADILFVRELAIDENHVATLPRSPADLGPGQLERLKKNREACSFNYDGEKLTPLPANVVRVTDQAGAVLHEWTTHTACAGMVPAS